MQLTQETIVDKAEHVRKDQKPFKIIFKDGKELSCESETGVVLDSNGIPTTHLNVRANGRDEIIDRDLIADIVGL